MTSLAVATSRVSVAGQLMSWDVPLPLPVIVRYAAMLGVLGNRTAAGKRRTQDGVTRFVRVGDVMSALGCSRSLAYEHLHRAGASSTDEVRFVGITVDHWTHS